MRRRTSLFLAAMLAGGMLASVASVPPAAAVRACGGPGLMTVNPGLVFPVLGGILGQPAKEHDIDLLVGGPQNLHGFSLGFSGGVCAHVAVPPTFFLAPANGILKGFCGHNSGIGTLAGEQFAFVGVGALLVFTGHLVGVATMLPASITLETCLHVQAPSTVTGGNPFALPARGVRDFLVQGATVGTNCGNALPSSEVLLRPTGPTVVLPTQTVGVHVDVGVHVFTVPPCTNPDVLLD